MTIRHTYRVGHYSLWFGATITQVADYLADVIAADKLDVLHCTEAKHRGLLRVLRHRFPGWRFKLRGEHLIAWRRGVFPHNGLGHQRTLTGVPYFTRGGGHRAFRVYRVRLTHFTGVRCRHEVSHCPAQVEGRVRFRPGPSARASQAGFRRWGRTNRHTLEHRPNLVLVETMDSNLDQHRGVWRDFLTRELGLPSIWRVVRPLEGTHGRRLIDTAHTNAPVSRARLSLVRPPHPFDHRGIVFDVEV